MQSQRGFACGLPLRTGLLTEGQGLYRTRANDCTDERALTSGRGLRF
jgi:hypothetical protein